MITNKDNLDPTLVDMIRHDLQGTFQMPFAERYDIDEDDVEEILEFQHVCL